MKFRKSSKIDFTSEIVYDKDWLEGRWGENHQQVIQLCRSQTKIPTKRRLGYGGVMANIVFYHSVPNNIPGVCGLPTRNGKDSCQGAHCPIGCWRLLTRRPWLRQREQHPNLMRWLSFWHSLNGAFASPEASRQDGVDHKYAVGLLGGAQEMGLLTPQVRLTSAGLDRLNMQIPLLLCRFGIEACKYSKFVVCWPGNRSAANQGGACFSWVGRFCGGFGFYGWGCRTDISGKI